MESDVSSDLVHIADVKEGIIETHVKEDTINVTNFDGNSSIASAVRENPLDATHCEAEVYDAIGENTLLIVK